MVVVQESVRVGRLQVSNAGVGVCGGEKGAASRVRASAQWQRDSGSYRHDCAQQRPALALALSCANHSDDSTPTNSYLIERSGRPGSEGTR